MKREPPRFSFPQALARERARIFADTDAPREQQLEDAP
jgi:hypothetical protein